MYIEKKSEDSTPNIVTQFQIKKEEECSAENTWKDWPGQQEKEVLEVKWKTEVFSSEPAATASTGKLLETQISNPTSTLLNLRTKFKPSPQDVLTHTEIWESRKFSKETK